MRHSVLWGKLAEQVFSQVFSGDSVMSPILALPRTYKRTKILHGDICLSSLADMFCKKQGLDYMYSLFTKITYILTCLLPLPSSFSEISEMPSLRLQSILPQIKVDSQPLCCAFFKSTLGCLQTIRNKFPLYIISIFAFLNNFLKYSRQMT